MYRTFTVFISFLVGFNVSFCGSSIAIEENNFSKIHEEYNIDEQTGIDNSYKGFNVLMISLGNVGAERMSLYGHKNKTTPFLEKWAKEAIVFENAFSPASWTLPVGTSLFTSLQPYTHQIIMRNINNRIAKSIDTLPEILKREGYKTATFNGGLDYSIEFGHMRGFEDTIENPDFTSFEITLKQAKDWLALNGDDKFFLFLHGYDTHCPFVPPEKFKGTFTANNGKDITVDSSRCVRGYRNYDGPGFQAYYAGGCPIYKKNNITNCIKRAPSQMTLTQDDIDYLSGLFDEEVLYTDSLIGEFLRFLNKKMLQRTIIVIMADHGEMFAKHGRFGRAGTTRGTLYDDVIHIPLIIKTPEKQSKKIMELVQTIDIMPTILDLLGIPITQKMQGKSLLPVINDNQVINEYVFAGLLFNMNEKRPPFYAQQSLNESIRNDHWKLIREVLFPDASTNGKILQDNFMIELYDIKDDPGELNNLADKYPDVTKDLNEKLDLWVERTKKFDIDRPTTSEISEKLLQNAIKQGYW